MAEIIYERVQRARRDYYCNACEYLQYNLDEISEGLSGPEQRAVNRARADGWQIKKGDVYIQHTVMMEGEMHTVKSIPAIHKICQKYRLYTE